MMFFFSHTKGERPGLVLSLHKAQGVVRAERMIHGADARKV